ncbi:hypothetical protein [Actinokineospora xionganensis]|uniref:Ferrochelatase n=1 Tax=Actinokineospora xionganensis TaxID=2684470 RepID=A0ABR7LC82_9PSEU|nr:hypothetical protein [Actinokineospora xionganensis]MBC6450198.1 hypothetical protein [Actinokineospora xionganensis]
MTTAIMFSAFGDPEVLTRHLLDDAVAGPGEVRARVRAAGVNPVDARVRRGSSPPWSKHSSRHLRGP